MNKILFQDTSFRDGFQSVFGARALTKDFIPAVEAAVDAGITHFEAGGGARFQSLFLYCGESAFDMMDQFRAAVGPDVRLQTLARGINVVALGQQPKDMIDLHAKMFKKHGMTRIRNFDALNDVNNLIYSGQCIKNAGLEHEVVITMMELPPGCSGAHDAEFYAKTLRAILDADVPFDSVCFKDASGTSNPSKVHEAFKAARKLLGDDVELRMHTHDTCGTGVSQYIAAINGGANGICVARKPLSGGTSQPDLFSVWHALKGTKYTLDIDIDKVMEANAVSQECFKDYFFPPEALSIDSDVIFSPMPGGALTANTMMMRDTGTLHLYPEVIKAMSECVARGGFGTSVTPVSQFYFQQAFANATQGPWKKITDGYGQMVLGYFGKTPVPPDAEIVKIASEQLGKPVFSGDPLSVLDPGIPKAKKILEENGLPVTDENIFIVGAFATKGGNKGLDFLKGDRPINVRKITKEDPKSKAPAKASAAQPTSGDYTVVVNGTSYQVQINEGTGDITTIAPSAAAQSPSAPTQTTSGTGTTIAAPLPGNVLNILVQVGQTVNEGDTLMILEAMKMETPVIAPCAGKVTSIDAVKGSTVETDAVLLTLH
jgi:pyruvate carboxylase subunit B